MFVSVASKCLGAGTVLFLEITFDEKFMWSDKLEDGGTQYTAVSVNSSLFESILDEHLR